MVEHFVAGTTARCAADLVGVNHKTAKFFFHRLRLIIFEKTESETPFDGEVEVDESYFGGARKGKRGRGAAGKIPVLGLLKRGGKVYARVIPDTTGKTLGGVIRERITPDSIVYTDTFPAYNVLDVSDFRHYRINHSKLFADRQNHINGIENFWNQAKRHMRRFNGIPKERFYLYLRECEWRFNNPSADRQLRQLRKWKKETMD